ncbi:hypothetical protein P9139_05470 [Curtobacterium flaccumfaciens]|nr:hypothetical protein P9139_05470 [Curtobacterium flaccumfaciens]
MSTTERTRALRRRMIVEARRSTVEHGLHGFTIEQLLRDGRGVPAHVLQPLRVEGRRRARHRDQRRRRGDRRVRRWRDRPDDLDPLDSIVALAIDQFHRVGIDRADEALVRRVFEREPALVARFLSATDVQLARITDAVRQRFGWDDPADRRARLVTEAAAALLKVTAETFFDDAFDEATGPPFDELLATNLRLLRAAITTGQDTTP